MNIKEVEFAPKTIGRKWKATYWKLFQIDPSQVELLEGRRELNWGLLFTQDLAQLENNEKKQLIDIGWYPDGDPSGYYGLSLIGQTRSLEWNWEEPIYEFECHSLSDLISEIKRLTDFSTDENQSATENTSTAENKG